MLVTPVPTPCCRPPSSAHSAQSLPPLETAGSRSFLTNDDSEGTANKGRRGSKHSSGGGGGGGGGGSGKKVRPRNSGDNISSLNNDSSDSNSVGGGRYTEDNFQDAEPLSCPPPGGEIRMSPQMSAVDSDGGAGGKGTEGAGSGGAEVGEGGGVRFVESPVGGQIQDGTGGDQALEEKEWTNNAIREMDKMREGIERRNSANEINGFNAMTSGSEVSQLAPRGSRRS